MDVRQIIYFAVFLLSSSLQGATLGETPTAWFKPKHINLSKLHPDPLEDHKKVAPVAISLSTREADLIEAGTKQYHDAYKEFLKDIFSNEQARIFSTAPEGFPSQEKFNLMINSKLRDLGYQSISGLKELFKKHRSLENTIVKIDLSLMKFSNRWQVVPLDLNQYHYGESPFERFKSASEDTFIDGGLESRYLEYGDFYSEIYTYLKERGAEPIAFGWDYKVHISTAQERVINTSSIALNHLTHQLKKLKTFGFTVRDPGYAEDAEVFLSAKEHAFPFGFEESQILDI